MVLGPAGPGEGAAETFARADHSIAGRMADLAWFETRPATGTSIFSLVKKLIRVKTRFTTAGFGVNLARQL
jgi:hypothetical protein